MSAPASSTLPPVGRIRPERRLKSDVLPAPFGPMMPRHSPAGTSSETSATIVAPPTSHLSPRVERVAALTAPLLERRDRRRGLVRRGRPEHLRHVAELRLRARDELHLEHRLQHRMVLRADRLEALRREELPALERGDHLVDVVVALLQRAHDHLPGDEAVRREQVGSLAALAQLLDE